MAGMETSAGTTRLGIPRSVRDAADALARTVVGAAAALGGSVRLDGVGLLTCRAELLGLDRPGTTSANGHSRFLACADGWAALSLARPDDLDAVEALTGRPAGDDPWGAVEAAARGLPTAAFVARGRLLGLPVAPLAGRRARTGPPVRAERRWPGRTGPVDLAGLRVADLSSLWAGPLAARILADAGARVTKVESASRPDGARRVPAFYALLHPADQSVVTVDLSTAAGRGELRRTLEAADLVLEGSRPRALEQLGLGPAQLDPRAGRVWVSVTGYGRTPPGREWVAFGDDGAAAGGLAEVAGDGTPHFVGDAIADPLTGLFAALGALDALRRGGGHLVDVALQRSAAWVARRSLPEPAGGVRPRPPVGVPPSTRPS